MTSKHINLKFAISFIITTIAIFMFSSVAWGADAAIQGIEFDQSANISLFVEQDSVQLKVLASVSGSTTKKDVTNDAFWLSSQPSVVKVDKGLLTPLKKGTSLITAKYQGFTITLTASSDYLFKSIVLDHTESLEVELGDEPELELTAIDHEDEEYIVTNTATWSTSNAVVATVSKGKLTLVGKGTATITATYKGLSTSVLVKVASPYSSIAIDPGANIEMLVGQDPVELKALAKLVVDVLTEDVTEDATWSSSNVGIVSVDKGNLTALAQGSSQIKVTYLGVSASIQVIVRLPYQALRVTPDEDLELFLTDEPVQLKAEVLNTIDSTVNVTNLGKWTTSNPVAVAVDNGKITPKATGNSVIGFTYRGMSYEVHVAVYPTISEIEISEESNQTFELFKEEVLDLPIIEGIMLSGQHLDMTPLLKWTSSDETIVTIKSGKMAAMKPGEATLTAEVRQFSITIDVTVQEKVLTLLSDVSIVSVIVGSEAVLPQVTAIFEDGSEVDVSANMNWKSSSPNLLVKETTIKAFVAGKVSLTGTYLNKKINVSFILESEIEKFIIDPKTIDLNPGRSKMISVKGVYKDGKTISLNSKIVWESSDSEIADVKRSTVKALKEGTVTLSGSYQGKSLQVTVKVIPKLKKLLTDATAFDLKVGETDKVNITALFDTGKTITVTNDAVWTSSNSTLVTINNGTIKALKKGSVTLKAIYQKKTIYVRVRVS
jgi:hypothetical protein